MKLDLPAVSAQQETDGFGDIRLVLDQQNPSVHAVLPPLDRKADARTGLWVSLAAPLQNCQNPSDRIDGSRRAAQDGLGQTRQLLPTCSASC